MALTDNALKALKPRDKTYTVTDDRVLHVEVFPTGGIVWRYHYRLNGKYEKLTLGKYPALTLKNAHLKRDEAAQQVAMGESPAKKKQQAKVAGAEDATVVEFSERFFKDIQSCNRSLEKFQLVFRQVLESLFIERMELNEELFTDYMGKPEMQSLVSKWLGSQVYERLAAAYRNERES